VTSFPKVSGRNLHCVFYFRRFRGHVLKIGLQPIKVYVRRTVRYMLCMICRRELLKILMTEISYSCYVSNSEDFRAKRSNPNQIPKISELSRGNPSRIPKISELSRGNPTRIPKISELSRGNPNRIPKISELNGGNPKQIPKISELNAAIRSRFRRFLS
jgi:alanine-alpha-ketoisovalerate/valine-pyruvate aminotransferase